MLYFILRFCLAMSCLLLVISLSLFGDKLQPCANSFAAAACWVSFAGVRWLRYAA